MIIKKSLHGHQTSNFYFIDYIDSGNMVKYCSVLRCCLTVHKTLFLAHCPGPVLKMHEWLHVPSFSSFVQPEIFTDHLNANRKKIRP